MDIITRALIDFGLSENEAAIYREALKRTETNPYALAQATGIPRTTVYEIIMGLSLKGLLELKRSDGLTKQQTRIRAVNPSVMRKILQKKRDELVRVENDVVHILPMLKSDFLQADPNADFQFFPGIDGAKKVFQMDETSQPSFCFNYKIPDDVFGRDYIDLDIDQEINHKKTYLPKEIFPLTDWTRHVFTYHFQRDQRFLDIKDYRYLDNPLFDLKVRLLIIGNQVRIISVENDECWGLIVRSLTLATSLKSIFMVMWPAAIPLTAKIITSWGPNEFFEAEKTKH